MEQESFLFGGVTLCHTMVEGKHCYEVGDVLTSKPCDFARKGDKLTMINDVETQHLSPKNFARMLSSGSPLLTLHRASIAEPEKNWPEFEPMRPYHKEETILGFSLDMVRETCLDKDEENSKVLEESQWESGYTDGNSFTDEEILLVSMSNTSVAIVQARGCDPQNPCNSCGRTGCSLSDYVMDNTQCKVTVSKEYITKSFERSHVLIQSLLQKSICPENIPRPKGIHPRNNPSQAKITIFYYMSNAVEDFDKGVPVVLNFSDSSNFLQCISVNGKPRLTFESCEKSKLQSICKGDPSAWPFVFYLKTTKDDHRRFESAAYSGWFIHTKPSGMVCINEGTNNSESNFYIIINIG